MKIVVLVIPLTFLLTACTADSTVGAEEPDLEPSRTLVKSFATRLQTELKTALGEGGPVAAIDVCKERAPLIAAELSRASGAKLRRTSLRYRNPVNAPEPWEASVLRAFDEQRLESPDLPLEYIERLDDGTIRYLSGISTGGVCLACHGNELATDIEKLLDANYPHDKARGYHVGEIRGAFSITWMAEMTETASGRVEESR